MTNSSQKRQHIPKKFGFRFKDAIQFPEMVVCGISFCCNARCIHCPNAKTNFTASLKGADQLMSWEVYKKIVHECTQYPHSLVRLSSAGEILMHPHGIEMIEYLLNFKKNVALTTNGSLLTPDKSICLLKAGIRSIEISVDAATSEIYEKIRPGLSFEQTLSNIQNLVRLRDQGKFKTRIMVSIIKQKDNMDSLEKIKKFWKNLVDVVLTRSLLSFSGLIDRGAQETYMPATVPCPFLWERVLIDPVGNLRACVNDIYNKLCVGNIMEQNISQLWQSDILNEWRRMHLEGKRNEMIHCKDCVDLEYRSWNYNYFHALNKPIE
ncbi:radical SAM/SPASM domain-containing protein [Desulfobacula toluolica]|uniref:Radical SAM domain protein n=1 Tax=Desulfobacula toluolica (strain DSM 7467 / Tol2) TaxID=651182 RepID=K0NNR3_DESTT|nr:radical SAM/SPASM domain-containing protein [Desulfobacula toluolica]CCK81688.1 radical SAM domain protein [Desulfobacula toluolica Tol2]